MALVVVGDINVDEMEQKLKPISVNIKILQMLEKKE